MHRDRTIHFLSLGCAKNRVDTEVMLGVSDLAGLRLVRRPEDADVIVVNTCGFIGPAREESVEAVLEMARMKDAGRCRKLVVAGCLSQRYPRELAEEMPEVNHFLGSSDMLELGRVLGGDAPRMLVGDPAAHLMRASDPRRLSQHRHSAFVKIAEGCDRSCSFCAIPALRGRQRSRPIGDLVEEVRALVARGVVEVSLVSQDTMGYGRDLPDRPRLAALVGALADVEGLRWLRVHYLYPEKLSAALLDLLAGHPRVLPYVDMPLQHASDAVLQRMKRGHGGDRLRHVVELLRERLGEPVLRTTFLVGHPGEGDDDFETLCDFVRWADFDHVGVFRYSAEEGTASFDMEPRIGEGVAAERRDTLMEIQREISRRRLASRVGEEIEVLVDGVSDETDLLLEGRHWSQAPEVDGRVYLANGEARPGELRRAVVTGASDYDLVADLLDAQGRRDSPPGAEPTRVHLPTLD